MFGRKKENTEPNRVLDLPENSEDPTMKDAVIEALKAVIDPDLGRNIVELGFVQNVRACDGHVAFNVELTTPACPVKDQLKKQCEDIVSALPGVKNVAVEMTAQVRAIRPPEIRNLIPGIQNAIAVASRQKAASAKARRRLILALALGRERRQSRSNGRRCLRAKYSDYAGSSRRRAAASDAKTKTAVQRIRSHRTIRN